MAKLASDVLKKKDKANGRKSGKGEKKGLSDKLVAWIGSKKK